jgi:phosphate acetyltransferase
MLIPTGIGTGLPSVSIGLVDAFLSQGIITKGVTLPVDEIELLYAEGKEDDLLDLCIQTIENSSHNADVIIISGLLVRDDFPHAAILNQKITKALDAQLIFVTTPIGASQIPLFIQDYDNPENPRILGSIINKKRPSDPNISLPIPILGEIPWNASLLTFRMKDLLNQMPLKVINKGEIDTRRVSYITLAARHVQNMIDAIKPGSLLIIAGDRVDILLAVCLAELRSCKLAGVILTGGFTIPKDVYDLCEASFSSGLPILSTDSDSYRTCAELDNFNLHTIPSDDEERRNLSRKYIAENIQIDWIRTFVSKPIKRHLTPAAFRFSLMEKARKNVRHILLPEATDPRILEAAAIADEKRIAKISLLGSQEEIALLCSSLDLNLPKTITIINPNIVRQNYVSDLVYLRRHRGVTEKMATDYLENNIILAMMMLYKGEVDGVVAGANTPTADVLRPALQIIKTKKESSLVSSIFFMCLETEVLIYGDCAVNTNPSASELANIAIQSADSARLFGIEPIVAMISYSTLQSGSGADVEKVREAIQYIKERRPDILVDGPLQYDAAYAKTVAAKKASSSQVAGRASVFIFPDLNTGNTTYKAVQQSADIYAFGPMLQGLNKPVNDLSRGAFVEDIVYTIAITAIQSTI